MQLCRMQDLGFQVENQLNWRSQQCTLASMKVICILGCISNRTANSSSKVNLVPYSTLARSNMKYCIQLGAVQYNNIDVSLGQCRKMEPGCSQRCTVEAGEAMDVRWNMGKFWLDTRKTFSSWQWSNRWSRCSEMLQDFCPWRYLNSAGHYPEQPDQSQGVNQPWVGSWTWWSPEVPSNLCFSVIL